MTDQDLFVDSRKSVCSNTRSSASIESVIMDLTMDEEDDCRGNENPKGKFIKQKGRGDYLKNLSRKKERDI